MRNLLKLTFRADVSFIDSEKYDDGGRISCNRKQNQWKNVVRYRILGQLIITTGLNQQNGEDTQDENMSSHYNNNTHFFFNIAIWLGISLGISLTVSLLLPFPTSLVVIITIFVILNFYMRRRLMQRTRTRARGKFSSVSSSFMAEESSSLKYSCINCGTQHRDISCPNCGSKIKKVVYW